MSEKQGYRPRTADEEILKLMLDGRDDDQPWGFVTPGMVADALDFSSEYAVNRLSMLNAAGLVEKPAKGVYVITDDGVTTIEE